MREHEVAKLTRELVEAWRALRGAAAFRWKIALRRAAAREQNPVTRRASWRAVSIIEREAA